MQDCLSTLETGMKEAIRSHSYSLKLGKFLPYHEISFRHNHVELNFLISWLNPSQIQPKPIIRSKPPTLEPGFVTKEIHAKEEIVQDKDKNAKEKCTRKKKKMCSSQSRI